MLRYDWVWGTIPAGFKKIVDGGKCRMIVRNDKEPYIRIDMCTAARPSSDISHYQGRSALRFADLQSGETALIRPYYHGGLFRRITRRIFFTWPPRPFRELAITEDIRRRGVPTVEVYGACIERVWGPLYRAWLITRELKGALDLWAACENGLISQMGSERILRPIATALRALHREGVYHRDLNLRNILIREETEGIKAYIIDFDRAKLFLGAVPKHYAQRSLDRLLRSIRKVDPERRHFTPGDWDRFVTWYHGAA